LSSVAEKSVVEKGKEGTMGSGWSFVSLLAARGKEEAVCKGLRSQTLLGALASLALRGTDRKNRLGPRESAV
jgi:hypothetical protein